MIFMLDIGSHLSFDLWMTLGRKNNISNVISVPKIVENVVIQSYTLLKLQKHNLNIDKMNDRHLPQHADMRWLGEFETVRRI